MQTRDIYISPADQGFWQAVFRDPADPLYADALSAVKNGDAITIDVLYGDHEGGQLAASRLRLRRTGKARPGWPPTRATGTSAGRTPADPAGRQQR